MTTTGPVTVSPVDEQILQRLTAVATTDADADEVTPPLTPGGTWTPERIAWFGAYHRSRRRGLNSPVGETTWAILHDGDPVGAIRLALTETTGELETGFWVARSARGGGIGAAALSRVIDAARGWGARTVRADTTATNVAALGLLRSLGFEIREPSATGRVCAVLPLGGKGTGFASLP